MSNTEQIQRDIVKAAHAAADPISAEADKQGTIAAALLVAAGTVQDEARNAIDELQRQAENRSSAGHREAATIWEAAESAIDLVVNDRLAGHLLSIHGTTYDAAVALLRSRAARRGVSL